MKATTLKALGINLPETNINLLINDKIEPNKLNKKTILGIDLLKRIIAEYHEDIKSICETKLDSPEKAVKYYGEELRLKERMECLCLFLDTGKHAIKCEKITAGNDSKTIMDIKQIAKKALLCYADSVLLMHNHPSGTVIPSNEDLKCTKDLKNALELISVKITDHIIIGKDKFYSFATEKTHKI